jgi:hypothetical protein
MRKRIPRGQVSARRKDKALKVLDELLKSPADHVRQKAAAALLASAREEGAEPADPDAPITYTILPDNQRDPGVRYGITGDPNQRVVIVPAGFPLEVRPESDYSDVPKPKGVVARRAEAKALVEAAMAADPEAFRADCEASNRFPRPDEPCLDPSRPWLDLKERQARRRAAALARLGLPPEGAPLAERVKAVQERMARQGIAPRPVVKLADGTFQFADMLPAPSEEPS